MIDRIAILRQFLVVLVLLCIGQAASGQENLHRVYFDAEEEADATQPYVEETRLHGSVGIGGGVMNGWGRSLGYMFVNPELSFKVSDRLQIGGGIGIAKGYCGQEFHLDRYPRRDYSPRKRTGVNYMHLDGLYAVSDRLTIYGSIQYVQGSLMPTPRGVESYAFGASAALDYRIGKNSHLGIYMHYSRGHNMPLLWYDDCFGSWGYPEFLGTPFAYRNFAFGMGDF